MRHIAAAAFFLALLPCAASAQVASDAAQPSIVLPNDGDDYSHLIAQAAARNASTDFRALRFAWLTSAARKRQSELILGGLTQEMMAAAQAEDHGKVRAKAVEILSARYTDMRAHLYLSMSCEKLRDTACAEQAAFVARGMFQSILKSGDGKTCDTGWDVALISEEYTVLSVMGLRMQQQALINGQNHPCDAMTATNEKGESVTHFFKIDRIMADHKNMLGFK